MVGALKKPNKEELESKGDIDSTIHGLKMQNHPNSAILAGLHRGVTD
jgi:hypothetical protein